MRACCQSTEEHNILKRVDNAAFELEERKDTLHGVLKCLSSLVI
jgi:hypothetical protein